MGILAVFGTFFLVRELFKKNLLGHKVALLTSFLLAISPWHIQFSRIAFEANIGVTINIWASYFFLRGFYSRRGFIVSAMLCALALYTYHSERIFVPCLVVFLIIIYRKQIILYKKRSLLLAGIVGILVLSPLIPSLLSKEAVTRLKGTSSFREQTVLLSNSIIKLEYDRIRGDKIGEIFDNRRVDYIKTILRGYLVHFSPNWLFITGDLYRHQAPDMGLLYFWEAPFILIGIFQLIRKKARENIFFIGWVLLAPIAASPITPVPHAIRTLVFLPSFHVFCAMGLISVFSFLYKRSVKWTIPLTVGIVVIIIGYFIYYVHMYFIHTNIEYSRYWYYGYRQALEYSEAHKGEYKKIVVSTDLEQPYMFFLFFSKYDPNKYLKQGGTVSGNFDEEFNHFDKYEFRKINWQNEKRDGSVLYIGTPDEIAHGTKANIMYLDGSPAIRITDRE